MPSMTLEQSRSDLRAMLGEHAPIYFSDAELNDWISQSQQDVAAITLAYHRRTIFANTDSPQALVAGVRSYALAEPVGSMGFGISDAIKVLRVFRDGNNMPKWSPEQVSFTDRRSEGGGTPNYWFEFAGHIGTVPYASTAFLATTWTIEVVYAGYPPEWTTGSSVLPSGFDELPTYLAYVKAMISRRKWADAGTVYQQFMQLSMQYRAISLSRAATPTHALKQASSNERVDEPSRVVPLRGRR